MGKLVVRYRDADAVHWGLLEGEAPAGPDDSITVLPLLTDATTTAALITALEAGGVDNGPSVSLAADRLLSPVTDDASIFCQGLNYGSHAAEAQHHVRKSNLIFSKASSALTGPYSNIVRPAEVELLDYEVELGVVLRTDLRAATQVTDATIGDVVAGVVLSNDVSARDTMFGATFLQWYQGKSYRTFCPVGPVLWLLDRDDVAETLVNLEISLWLNGELRQSAPSTQLIWKPGESLAYISKQMDLKRGDLLLTGTPGGVTSPASPKLVDILKDHLMDDDVRREALRAEMVKTRPFMKPGDVVTAMLRDVRTGRSLGGLANRIAAA
jgi:2-keto-4-pentenoate hydratase/2-oxohepta-3-ene-1,7-dioic acid hydratase in catechol pathway